MIGRMLYERKRRKALSIMWDDKQWRKLGKRFKIEQSCLVDWHTSSMRMLGTSQWLLVFNLPMESADLKGNVVES